MVHILTIESEYESALRLGYTKTIKEFDYASDYKNHVVVRWGNSFVVNDLDQYDNEIPSEFPQVINPGYAIKRNVRKNEAIKLLRSVVNTPRMWESGEPVPENVTAVHRIVRHHGGEGFNVQVGPFNVQNKCYATEWIPSQIEYRVWFCGADTMCGIRMKRSPCLDKYPCRSTWGYNFQPRVPAQLHKETLLAAKTIGLECGAADILDYQGKYYFLELNSAATIDKMVIETFYRNSLNRLIRSKYARFMK